MSIRVIAILQLRVVELRSIDDFCYARSVLDICKPPMNQNSIRQTVGIICDDSHTAERPVPNYRDTD